MPESGGFRTGARGGCLVPYELEGTQNLFDMHRTAKPTWNLQHLVWGGASKQFCACGHILLKSETCSRSHLEQEKLQPGHSGVNKDQPLVQGFENPSRQC
ncbi:hypothetical protein AVEN_17196-1 [Araneus ventricosus]|uniref:Uncharacterized protein n=1 Tax=Araneus ventricosus TaxID=182803 RepID=A0A4Y2DRQ6_ARAVE|nr:hypothetical protein AVEN_17196-1 [Araneus ventricosus]